MSPQAQSPWIAIVMTVCIAPLSACNEDPPATQSDDAGVASGNFQPRQRLPQALRELAVVATPDRIVLAGGFHDAQSQSKSVYLYDTETDRFRDGPALPEARHELMLAAVGEDVYALGGRRPETFAATNTAFVWRAQATEWQEVARMPEERANAVAVAIAGRVYVAGGQERTGAPAARLMIYDPMLDAWSFGPELPTPRTHAAGFVREDELWVVGGRGPSRDANLDVTEVFDPETMAWRTGPSLRTERSQAGAAALGERIVVTGGVTGAGAVDSAEASTGGEFRDTDAPQLARFGHTMAAKDDVFYVFGGATTPTGTATDAVEAWDLAAMRTMPVADAGP